MFLKNKKQIIRKMNKSKNRNKKYNNLLIKQIKKMVKIYKVKKRQSIIKNQCKDKNKYHRTLI